MHFINLQGFFKFASITPGVLRSDVGSIQQCINTPSLHSFQQSSSNVPSWWWWLVLMNVMRPLHWLFSSYSSEYFFNSFVFFWTIFFVIELCWKGVSRLTKIWLRAAEALKLRTTGLLELITAMCRSLGAHHSNVQGAKHHNITETVLAPSTHVLFTSATYLCLCFFEVIVLAPISVPFITTATYLCSCYLCVSCCCYVCFP